jgi:ribonuclease D
MNNRINGTTPLALSWFTLHRLAWETPILHAPLTAHAHLEQLQALADALARAPAIGLDTEFLRDRTYRAQLCLLQLGTRDQFHCIDPLGNDQLGLFATALASPAVTKVMHAARQDLEVLWPIYGAVTPVFDTQVAAGLAGWPAQVGYADLVQQLLGVTLDKSHTRTDWSQRPLSAAQVSYAIEDVRHLLPLRDLLLGKLDALGRLDWVAEDCSTLGEALFVEPANAWQRLKGLQELDDERLRLAKALAAWRERKAADKDRPRSWILDDAGLRAIVNRVPRDLDQMRRLAELAPGFVEHSGPVLLALIEELDLPRQLPPLAGRRAPDAEFNQQVKALANVVRQRATELGIGPELLATRRDLEQLARGERQTPVLSGWRAGVIGKSLLALC